jgi:DNA polymerase-3 subunit delta
MIIKFYDLKKFLNSKTSIFLFYGQNVSLIEETINKNIKRVFTSNIYNYEESEVLSDINEFQISLYNKSFFDNEKLIIINRVTDKILELIKNIIEKNNESIKIILKSGNLERKSKLRNFFEKNKDLIILPFYEDNHKSLMDLALNFFKENKIKISTQNINYILQKIKGNRLNLKNELEKIKSLSKSNSIIEFDHLLKIISNSEDYKISELTDYCLAKNKNKTIKILNDNNFIKDDSILILKSFLHKLKRLIILKKEITIRKDQESVISSYKPTIFWKDKDIIKQQLNSLSANDIKTYIKKINSLELLIKKNPNLSNEIANNFIFETINNSNNLI